MARHRAVRWCWGLVLVAAATAAGQSGKPLTLDDLFRLEQIGRYFGGPVAFSQDGEWLAFVIARPKASATNHKLDFLWGNDRSDVLVVPAKGGTPRNITNGATDGAGFWSPVWSPDGARLAMLSTRGGNVRLWIWERSTNALRLLTTRAVDLSDTRKRPHVWISSTQILCPVLAEGEKPSSMSAELRAAEKATAAWSKTWRGVETAVSVLQSGVPVELAKRDRGTLLLLDSATGASRVVLEGSTQELTVSPNGREVAFLRLADIYRPHPGPLEFGARGRFEAVVVSLAGQRLLGEHALNKDVIPGSLRWSPSGVLAFVARPASADGRARVVTHDPATRSTTVLGSARIDPAPVVRQQPQLLPAPDGDWLVFAARSDAPEAAVYARRDWWLVGADTERLLTAEMKSPPSKLVPEASPGSYVGLSEGALWRIRADGPAPANLTASLAPKLTTLVWPEVTSAGDTQMPDELASYPRIFAGAQNGASLDVFQIDLATSRATSLPLPAPAAKLMGYDDVSGTVLFSKNDRTGTAVWTAPPPYQNSSQIYEANTFLRDIASAEVRLIEYRDLEGQPAKAWVWLPIGYREGERVPVLVWVYPGSVAGPRPGFSDDINYSSALNLQIAAARGYAVMKPSMPLKPEGDVDDPYMRLTGGVLPAVDKLIDLGIADPNRLFVGGQSFGGYATYGLVTQTNRFKAAVALAGLSNLTSIYGVFDARDRYDDYPHENLFMESLSESAQLRLGGPPWKDLGRYLRNSPISYVDRVQTPLMIVQGDMDYVALQQGEEFFSALYRQGKRAAFVRYWGEGHVVQSPANARDMWERIFAWFDEFGGKGTPGLGTGAR